MPGNNEFISFLPIDTVPAVDIPPPVFDFDDKACG